MDNKPTNPKDLVAVHKLPINLVPPSLTAYAALAFYEGARKYGAFNWREKGVRMSVYIAAMERHRLKLMSGEWEDPATHVPHLASIVACAGIILDARLAGKLTDDRPPECALVADMINQAASTIGHIDLLFAGYDPQHCTVSPDATCELP